MQVVNTNHSLPSLIGKHAPKGGGGVAGRALDALLFHEPSKLPPQIYPLMDKPPE